jgi:hypothetical protein
MMGDRDMFGMMAGHSLATLLLVVILLLGIAALIKYLRSGTGR